MSSIYMYNALVGAKIEEDNTDYYYLTRLLNFRNEYSLGKIKDEEFTDKLLDVLKRNPRFEKLSRLCISVAYPLSHKIGVLSAATTVDKNLMDTSYSCYVSRTSSLDSISTGTIRVYGDLDKIIDEFVETGKPLQRSLHFLNRMGVKSGMTMRLQSRGLKGFLFLNSNEKDYFDHIERDYATYINLLELICLEFFNRKTEGFFSVSNLESYLEKFPHSEILSNSHLKGEEGMLGISKFVSQHMEGQVKIFVNDKTDKKFLVPWGQISLILALVLKELGIKKEMALYLDLFEEKDQMKIAMVAEEFEQRIEELSYDHYRAIRKFAKNIGIDLIKQKGAILFAFDVDYNENYSKIAYSTFQE